MLVYQCQHVDQEKKNIWTSSFALFCVCLFAAPFYGLFFDIFNNNVLLNVMAAVSVNKCVQNSAARLKKKRRKIYWKLETRGAELLNYDRGRPWHVTFSQMTVMFKCPHILDRAELETSFKQFCELLNKDCINTYMLFYFKYVDLTCLYYSFTIFLLFSNCLFFAGLPPKCFNPASVM